MLPQLRSSQAEEQPSHSHHFLGSAHQPPENLFTNFNFIVFLLIFHPHPEKPFIVTRARIVTIPVVVKINLVVIILVIVFFVVNTSVIFMFVLLVVFIPTNGCNFF